MTLHRGHAAAATPLLLTSTWILRPLWPNGGRCLVPWRPPLSLWISRCMAVSSPPTLGPRAAQWSWLQPHHLNAPARSAEGVTSWKGRWPSSGAQDAAAVCRAPTPRVGTPACMGQHTPAAIMILKLRIQIWRGSYRDSGRSKQDLLTSLENRWWHSIYSIIPSWSSFILCTHSL